MQGYIFLDVKINAGIKSLVVQVNAGIYISGCSGGCRDIYFEMFR